MDKGLHGKEQREQVFHVRRGRRFPCASTRRSYNFHGPRTYTWGYVVRIHEWPALASIDVQGQREKAAAMAKEEEEIYPDVAKGKALTPWVPGI